MGIERREPLFAGLETGVCADERATQVEVPDVGLLIDDGIPEIGTDDGCAGEPTSVRRSSSGCTPRT